MRFVLQLFTVVMVTFVSSSLANSAQVYSALAQSDSLSADVYQEIQPLQTNAPIAQRIDANTPYPPASTLKILTALAAKIELGDDFRFTTQLKRSDRDWALVFSGDPTLTRDDLAKLFASANKQGYRTINGDLWLDDSVFSGYERAVGWPWDALGVCYSAPASAISLDHNCAYASLYTKANGGSRVYLPEHYPLDVTTDVKSVSKEQQKATLCDLELHSDQQNRYRLAGCLVTRDKPLPLKFAVQSPALYTQSVVKTLLKQNGITLKGEIRVGTPPKTRYATIATHQSETLAPLLTTMLRDSDNLIADNLTKTLGRHHFNSAGSFQNGTAAIKAILASVDIDLTQAQLADGSGLSRNNRLTPLQMMATLNYIWQNDDQLKLIALLPTAGVNGTLQYRSSMRAKDITGQIMAKSGSVYGTYNMAGYGLNQQGQPSTLFVHFVRDFFPNETLGTGHRSDDLKQAEQQFYRNVIRQSH